MFTVHPYSEETIYPLHDEVAALYTAVMCSLRMITGDCRWFQVVIDYLRREMLSQKTVQLVRV